VQGLQLAHPTPIEALPLQFVRLPEPEPAADELVLDVVACAICRTDLQIVEGDLEPRHLPIIPGHQAVGRVVKVGSGVRGWREGDRAGIGWLASVDGTCDFCTSGRENLCPNARFTGWDRDGGYATAMTLRADFALRIPSTFDDVAAAPLLCGGVIGYRSLKVSGVRHGGRLGLFGFGSSAFLTLQVAREWGCEVHVRTRSPKDRRRALDFGAASADGYDVPTRALEAAITFAPVGSVVVDALRNLDRGATVVVNAIHLDEMPAFPYELLWLERAIRSVANYTRQDAREFLELAADIPIRTDHQEFPLAEGNEALRRLKAGQLGPTGVLVAPDD
jgi:alcohol dehydrogenase, propanol-preferring